MVDSQAQQFTAHGPEDHEKFYVMRMECNKCNCEGFKTADE